MVSKLFSETTAPVAVELFVHVAGLVEVMQFVEADELMVSYFF